MKCKKCGFDNPDYLEYCRNCSAPLGTKHEEDGKEPAWGFVKAPKWANPDFSADTVSDEDVPEDFIHDAKQFVESGADYAESTVAAAGAAVAGAAADVLNSAKSTGRKARAELDDFEDDFAEEYGDKLDELEDEFDELDDFDHDYRKSAEHAAEVSLFDKLRSTVQNPSARPAKSSKHAKSVKPAKSAKYSRDVSKRDELDDIDDYDDYDSDDYGSYKRAEKKSAAKKTSSGRKGGSVNLTPLIKIAAVIAALAVLAACIWLIAKKAKSCSTKDPVYDAPVVEAGDDGSFYFITLHAPEGTQLVYETTDGGRTPYTVPETCVAKFKVPVSGLMPGEPIEGSTYFATPRVLTVNEDGTETPISIDSIAIPVPQLGLTLDNEDEIVTEDGKAKISGRVDYINAEVTVDGEPVEVGSDGSFSKEFVFDEVGTYDIEVEAKLPNYQITRRGVKVTVIAPVVTDPDAVIQMPWDYGDNTFSQRIVYSLSSIDVRGKVPAGSTVTASLDTTNATVTKPTVDDDGTFHFTLTMQFPGDYTVKLGCTTPDGGEYEREVHLQRQPDYSPYVNAALPADYSAFSFGTSQQYILSGTVNSIEHDGDYYLAKFELTDGHIIMLEYHPHYGTAGTLEVGKSYTNIVGRSKGFDDAGNVLFYVWFFKD